MIGIIDYNAGNIKSVERALDSLGIEYVCSKNPLELQKSDKIIFPGVGEANFAMKQLNSNGGASFLKDFAASGKPLLGICLGSQIIFDYSEEGDTQCLGILKGKIRHFENLFKENNVSYIGSDSKRHGDSGAVLKIPHMGWSSLTFHKDGTSGSSDFYLVKNVRDGSDFYFVHSYVIQPESEDVVVMWADYGVPVPAVIHCGNVMAAQFHPEKSAECGLSVLRAFAEGV
ncbi:MAG: imidazole glycerol phosphate synthase subunit HisH [Treponemataceae bacterium]|nr:imidazole glycerol phosphate synthase subunit HisH [Treponemataceae bacterium]